jgi:surface polysaccharide O-acyltransferase-like enzyme
MESHRDFVNYNINIYIILSIVKIVLKLLIELEIFNYIIYINTNRTNLTKKKKEIEQSCMTTLIRQ